MKKTFSMILFLLLSASQASAQQQMFRLSGSVVDSFTGEAVDSCQRHT